MKLQLYNPLTGSICSQGFGVNEGADYPKVLGTLGHPGRDFIVVDKNGVNISYGRNIRAAHSGTVLSLELDNNGGYTVVLLTDKAYDYKDGQSYFKTVYAHCIPGSFKVRVGQYVKIGDVLALCGASGVYPGDSAPHQDKAHVHFSLKPAQYVTEEEGVTIYNPYWENSEQKNGYSGAIDDTPYMSPIYAKDYLPVSQIIEGATAVLETVKSSSTMPIETKSWFYTKVVQLLNTLLSLFKR